MARISEITVRFLGNIYPALPEPVLPRRHMHRVNWNTSFTGLEATTVEQSVVSVDCMLNRFELGDFDGIHLAAFRSARAVVDLSAFIHGVGLTLIIDKFVGPDGGQARTIHSQRSNLRKLSTISFNDSMKFVALDAQLMRALNELTGTLERPDEIYTDCAGGIERLTHILAPKQTKAVRWKALRDALQLSEPYVKLISRVSEGPRHGDPDHPYISDTFEAQQRAWVIMDRFLHFLKRGNIPLTADEFPLL